MGRLGFTLLEVLLALALVVLLAGLMFSQGNRELDDAGLTAAADQFRAAVAQTRVAAIEAGRVYELCCTPEGAYQARPQGGLTRPADAEPDQSGPAADWTLAGRLPEGFGFQQVDVTAAEGGAGTSAAEETPGGEIAAAEPTGFPPIVFYPDGTTSSARVRVAGPEGRSVEIAIQGLLGQAAIQATAAAAEE